MSREGCNDVKAHAAPLRPIPNHNTPTSVWESAPVEYDEHIRKKTDVVASHCCNRFKGRMP